MPAHREKYLPGAWEKLDININGERYNDESVNTNVEFANLVSPARTQGLRHYRQ